MKQLFFLCSLSALLTTYPLITSAAESPVSPSVITDADAQQMTENIRDFIRAVERGQSSKVRALLNVGVNPNIMLESGDTPLTHALRYDDWATADVLMKSSLTDASLENRLGETPLMLAVFKNRNDYFEQLLQKGAAVNKPSGWTALHYAATEGRTDMLKRLLSLGARVNAQTQSGVTPLHMAARIPHRECVILLLKAGAYRDYCTNAGLSPADMARKAGDHELADFLAVEHCAVRGPAR